MDDTPQNEPTQDEFNVNSIHIGADTIQLINEDGATMYFPMTERCQKDRVEQADSFAGIMKQGSYQDGLEDGQQVGLFMAYRIIKAEKKLHAYNSGAGRVLKSLEEKLKRQTEVTTAVNSTAQSPEKA